MIETLSEFSSQVFNICSKWGLNKTTHPWFRGQSNIEWELTPTIYRNNGDNYWEREMIRDFRLNTERFWNKSTCSDIELLFLMQHHGMPTRLLDWTESYLFALYFAVLNFSDNKDCAVWILQPWSLNIVTLELLTSDAQWTVPVPEDKRLQKYVIGDNASLQRQVQAIYPLAIRPNRSSSRIIAQKGMFTIHGSDSRTLNKIINELNSSISDKILLERIDIKGTKKLDLLIELNLAGISHSVLFPEMEGVAKDISFRYSKNYIQTGKGHNHSGF